MFLNLSIRPSRDIRTNYAEISRIAKENPVAITVNGREDLVIMSHEQFMQQQRYIEILESQINWDDLVQKAENDIAAERIEEAHRALQAIRKELGL